VLCAGTRIEAHNEVVTVVVCGLQLLRWLGEEESAPVGDAADDALLIEDDLASGFGNSTRYRVSRCAAVRGVVRGRNYSFTSERRPGRTCRH
jgi:hypothetical protein